MTGLIYSLVVSSLMLGLGVFVLVSNPSGTENKAVFRVALFSWIYILFSSIRDTTILYINTMNSAVPPPIEKLESIIQTGRFFGIFGLIGGALLAASIVEFSLRYLFQGSQFDRATIVLSYSISGLFAAHFGSSAYIWNTYAIIGFDHVTRIARFNFPAYFIVYIAYLGLMLAASIGILLLKALRAPTEYKLQAKWIGGFLSCTLMFVFIFSVLLPGMGFPQLILVGRLSFCLTFLGMFVSITRYQAFNIQTAIHYTIYWITTSCSVTLPLLGIVVIFTPAINQTLNAQFTTTGLFILLLASCIIAILHFRWIQPKLNQKFFKQKFHLRDQAIGFSEKISQIYEIDPLINTIKRTFQSILYSSTVDVVLSDTPHTHDADQISIPLTTNTGLVGTIIVGQKKNLKPYSSDELVFMNRIGHQSAIFLKNALLYESLQAKNRELIALQEALITAEREKVATEQHQLHTQELSRGIIHEVKNTHFSISNYITLIVNQPSLIPEKMDPLLHIIGEQSAKLHLFSKNFLHHELIRSQLYQVRRSTTRVRSILDDAIKSNHFFIESNELSIQFDIPELDTIFADKDKMHLVFCNLINNAAKYKKQNQLRISAYEENGEYSISFTSQLGQEPPEKSFEEGTGFGLKVARYIIDYHSGTLNVTQNYPEFSVSISVPQPQKGFA